MLVVMQSHATRQIAKLQAHRKLGLKAHPMPGSSATPNASRHKAPSPRILGVPPGVIEFASRQQPYKLVSRDTSRNNYPANPRPPRRHRRASDPLVAGPAPSKLGQCLAIAERLKNPACGFSAGRL